MRHLVAVFLMCLTLGPCFAGESYSRTLSGWFNVTTPDGWSGRRYMDGPHVFAEEFDSNGDGRVDVWRFYRQGLLSSEERDTNAAGRVNFQSKWEAREGRLLSVLRDTRSRGINDLEIEYTARNRWEIREDRNLDGITDHILFVNGPPDLFEILGMDLATQTNVIDNIPGEYWHELWSDETFVTVITDYRRFSNGELTHYGEWDGRRVAWRRVSADFVPPPLATPPPAATGRQTAGMAGTGQGTGQGTGVATPYTEPATTATPGYVPQGGAFRDRTRYDSMPPGESAARSVPARMRPPGTSRR